MSSEAWRPVEGWPYEVSNMGQVRRAGSESTLKPSRLPNGYLRVHLYDAPRDWRVRVHRLVLAAFVGPCPPGHESDHINQHRDDNRVENLRWLPRERNRGRNTLGEEGVTAVLTGDDVVAIRERYRAGETSGVLAEEYGVHMTTICDAIRGRTWGHYRPETIVPASETYQNRDHVDQRGEANGYAKITEADAIEIIRLDGVKPRSDIAEQFGISASHVNSIQGGERWSHLHQEAPDDA